MGINASEIRSKIKSHEEPNDTDEYNEDRHIDIDPFDIDDTFQEKLLGNLIHDEEFLDRIGDVLKPSYFNKEEYQYVCKVIVDYYRKYSKPITETVLLLSIKEKFKDPSLEQLKKKVLILSVTLFDLSEIGKILKDSEEIQSYTLRFIKQQEMKLAIIKSAELIPTGDFETIYTTIEHAFSVGVSKDLGTDMDDMEDREKTKPRKDVRPLPWPALNRRTKGGLGRGEFAVIIAPMGAGKTMIAANLMAHARRIGQSAILYSLEMAEAYNRHRIDAIHLGLDLDDLDHTNPEYRERLQDKLELYPPSKHFIKHFHGESVTVQTLKTHIKQLKSKGMLPDLLVIDYLDIMDPLDPFQRSKKDWEKFEVIAREVSNLGKQEDVAIIGLIQTNTEGLDKEVISAKNTSGGAKRLHVCDLIFGYARPDHFKVMEKATWSFIKNRFGKDGFALEVETAYNKCYIHVKDSEFFATEDARETFESKIKKKASDFGKNQNPNKPDDGNILGTSLDDDPFQSSI